MTIAKGPSPECNKLGYLDNGHMISMLCGNNDNSSQDPDPLPSLLILRACNPHVLIPSCPLPRLYTESCLRLTRCEYDGEDSLCIWHVVTSVLSLGIFPSFFTWHFCLKDWQSDVKYNNLTSDLITRTKGMKSYSIQLREKYSRTSIVTPSL